MVRRTRVGVLGLVATMTAPVAVAGLAWACGPSGYGVPETPAAPPASTAQPAPSTVRPPAPSEASAPAQAPAASAPAETGSATTRSVRETAAVGRGGGGGERGSTAPQRPSQLGGAVTGTAPRSSTQADIRARVHGSTAGVVQQGRQSVFASSTAPAASKADRGKGKARSSASGAPAVSEGTASSEGWSGVTSTGASPSLESAAAAEGDSGGLSSGVVMAVIALLGLGLAGITGAALVTGRRRRAAGAGGAPKNE